MVTHPDLNPSHKHDPETSKMAAATVNVNRQMLLVLEALAHATGPLTNDQIHSWSMEHSPHYRGDYPHALSTRRGKLEDRGLVVAVDRDGVSRAGRACSRYAITPQGRNVLNTHQQKAQAPR